MLRLIFPQMLATSLTECVSSYCCGQVGGWVCSGFLAHPSMWYPYGPGSTNYRLKLLGGNNSRKFQKTKPELDALTTIYIIFALYLQIFTCYFDETASMPGMYSYSDQIYNLQKQERARFLSYQVMYSKVSQYCL